MQGVTNILQFISSIGFFGAENVVLHLSSELQTKELYVPIVGVLENLQNPHSEVAKESRKNGIETVIFPCRGRFDLKTIKQLRRFIRKREIDIIHSHGYKSNLYSFAASYRRGASLVATCHNWLGDDPKMKFYATLDRFFLRRFDDVVAVSDDVRKRLICSGVCPKKVTVVKNGITLDRFERVHSAAKIRSDLGIPHDCKVIGTVGRISEEKGHIYLLRAAEKVRKQYPKTVFLIVGDGPLRKELQREYDSPSIVFAGITNDVPHLYHCMDIFVLPSLTEGLPMVLLEAMAARKPLVATRVGAVPNVIQDGHSGCLVEPGDVKGLAQAITDLLANPQKAHHLAKHAHRKVKQDFSSQRMAEKYIEVYQDVLGIRGAED